MRTKRTKIYLIGGRLDGSISNTEHGRKCVVLNEIDNETNLKTGRHLVYTRVDKGHIAWREGSPRYVYTDVYVDNQIIEFSDGPLKGAKTTVPNDDGYVLMRCQDGAIAAYLKKGKTITFEKSFPKGHEAEAEDFAKDNSIDKED